MGKSERKILMVMTHLQLKVNGMSKYKISLNPFAEFSTGTEAVKRRIINQQIIPSKFKMTWYQLAKARIKKSLECKGDLQPIFEGLNELRNRKPATERKKKEDVVSVECLERYIQMNLPKALQALDSYEVVKVKQKSFNLFGVEVVVAPDVIVKGVYNGRAVVGGLKLHVSKNKPFDLQKSQIVAVSIFSFLSHVYEEEEVEVLPDLCFSLDVFADRFVSATERFDETVELMREICDEIREYYDKLVA